MLEKVKASDFKIIYGLYMNPEINPFLLYEMMDEASFQPIFDDLLKEDILYLYKENNQIIGMCKLIRLKYRCEHIMYLGGLAIDSDFSGKGFGKKMILEIINFCSKIGILRIELSVAIHNQKAIQLYEKMGFEKEGILRNYAVLKKDNIMFDEIIMSYLF